MVCAFFFVQFPSNTSIVILIYSFMENEYVYTQPQVEIISIDVENGFAASDFIQDPPGAWD